MRHLGPSVASIIMVTLSQVSGLCRPGSVNVQASSVNVAERQLSSDDYEHDDDINNQHQQPNS